MKHFGRPKNRLASVLAATSLLLAALGQASASPVTYVFTGTVTSVDPGLAATFNTSQTLSGSFTYESATPGVFYGSPASGFSNYYGALSDFRMTIGSYTATPPFGHDSFSGVQVANNWSVSGDRFNVGARLSGVPFYGFNPYGALFLEDPSNSEFTNTELASVGDLSGWPSRSAHYGWWYLAFSYDGSSPRVDGRLTSITRAGIPEPSQLTLLLTAGALVLVARKLRVQSRR